MGLVKKYFNWYGQGMERTKLGIADIAREPLPNGTWSEAAMQAYIVRECRRAGILVRGGLEGVALSGQTRGIAKATGMDAGWPDLHFPTHHTWVELKTLTGALKPHQEAIHDKLRAAGDVVHVVVAGCPKDAWQQVQAILCTATHKAVDLGREV